MSIDRPIGQPVLIKRYAGRRLYNVDSMRYVTPDDLAAMLRQRQRFVVREAESGENITSQIVDALASWSSQPGDGFM
jgi:polyhydroxyalkanoate synthesis regulator protein